MNKVQAAAYLAGMIDGEGHIRVERNRSASVANTDWDLIEATVECCELLGLHYTVQRGSYDQRGNRKPVWEVRMAGKDTLLAIDRLVPLRSKRKRQAVKDAVAAYKQVPRPPREWLVEKYENEGLSLQQCAEAWGVKNSASAHQWLKYYGIPARTAGGSVRKPPPPESVLRRMYVDEMQPVRSIVAELGAHNEPMLYRWLRLYDIPLRTRK